VRRDRSRILDSHGEGAAVKRFLVVTAPLLACAVAVACNDGPQSHVYVASLYQAAGACLDPSTTLAIIGTPNGSLECKPACLVQSSPPPASAATETLYLSTMCAPYPTTVTPTTDADPACAAALAAYASGAVCGEDVGPEDGGDDGGTTDAGTFDADADGDDSSTTADAGDSG
jgi:hypothetical protein